MLFRLIAFSLFLSFWSYLHAEANYPQFQDSKLDLRNWEFQTPIKLQGDIEFYSDVFLNPGEVSNESSFQIPIGSGWNSIVDLDSKGFQAHGYGTYRFSIFLNDSSIYSLYIPTVSTAYNLFVNGDYVSSVGTPGKNRSDSTGYFYPQVIQLPQTEKIDILMQISNFEHIKGGLWKNIKIGKRDQINRIQENGLALDFFIFGSFIIMAFYHLGLYILHKKEMSTLYFGLFLLILSFRSLVTGEHFLYKYLGMNFFTLDWGLRIEFSAFYLGIPLALVYFESIFPKESNKKIIISISSPFLFIGLLTFFLPAHIFTQFTYYIEYFIILTGLYVLFIAIKAVINNSEGCYLALFGFLVFFIFVLNDILYTRKYLDTGYYAHVGFFLFVLIQSFFISRRFAKAFHRVEDLSSNLEKLVEIRTEEYKIQKQKAEDAGLWKDNLISLVAHDLRSPLSSFYNVLELLEDEEFEADEKKQIIKSSKNMIRHSLSSITHLLSLNRFQNGIFELSRESVNLREFMISIVESMKQEMDEKNQRIELDISHNYQANFDPHLISEVIRNILLNSMKYSPKNSPIKIQVKSMDGHNEISVIDQGLGMTQHEVENIVAGKKQESKRGTSGEKGFGIGMSICKQLIQAHGGLLKVESSLGNGTVVSLSGLDIRFNA